MSVERKNLACKNCGTKVFKSPGEADNPQKETHPEESNQESGEDRNQDAGEDSSQ